jgi:hypothetical protein
MLNIEKIRSTFQRHGHPSNSVIKKQEYFQFLNTLSVTYNLFREVKVMMKMLPMNFGNRLQEPKMSIRLKLIKYVELLKKVKIFYKEEFYKYKVKIMSFRRD